MTRTSRSSHNLALRILAPALLCVLTALAAHANAKKPSSPGRVAGKLTFAGAPPAPATPDRSTDPFCSHQAGQDAAITVTDGGLAGALISLESKALPPEPPPDTPVVVRQSGCSYLPRVAGAVVGQLIEIHNADATLHNVHAHTGKATAFNLAQPKGAQPIRRTADEPGVVELTCDVHPWMRAYVVALSHRYFAVTGADGSFAIENVPPGRYTIKAWHPVLGTRTAELSVTTGKTATPALAFTAK